MRKLLSVTTPVLLQEGYTEEFVGTLSFAYMLMYALGQLVNGRLGDCIRPRWMILTGLSLSGLALILFPFVPYRPLQAICFGALGFFLSMLRGPLVKLISENTSPKYARWCCTGISVVTYVGPLIAALLAIVFRWQMVFVVGGGIGVAVGAIAWVLLTHLETVGETTFCAPKEKKQRRGYAALFKLDRFVLFLFLSALFEISGASVDAWVSTYLVQRLGFSVETANLVYSAMSAASAICPFLCLVLFRVFREGDARMLQFTLLTAAVLYGLMSLVTHPLFNTVLFVAAVMATSISSSVLWSIYIPGLGKSGQVSTANGVLDFAGYVGAAFASLIFSRAIGAWGWTSTVLLWGAVPLIGCAAVTLNRLVGAHIKK